MAKCFGIKTICTTHIITMKKFFILLFALLLAISSHTAIATTQIDAHAYDYKYKIAIVIDDFGSEDRTGVDEILELNIPLTCAVMPGMTNSASDAETAFSLGHEVILHMPMEASLKLPDSWYGPKVIRNYFSEKQAVDLVDECIKSIPHAIGMNIHMGTGISRNKNILSAIMKYLKESDKYFLDSKTVEDSMCPASAQEVGFNLLSRDVFIENHNNHSYAFTKSSMQKAKEIAIKNGYCIAIGHVGPEGGPNTINAINDSIEDFKNSGIEFVKLSEIYNLTKKSI